VRNVGWSAYLMDGHSRWEGFELLGSSPADLQPPDRGDLWVRSLRPRGVLAPREQRCAILKETASKSGEAVFGTPLDSTRSAAYLQPGTGERSLATLIVEANQPRFDVNWRIGTGEPDVRVELPLPDLGRRWLPVKDHHLLLRAERATLNVEARVTALKRAIQQMGDLIAVRLGLSRSFQGNPDRGSGQCWLMADGFFSLHDPQP